VKIPPSSLLITGEPVNFGGSEMSPEITMGLFTTKNRGAARDWTYEWSWCGIEIGGGLRGL